MKHTKLLTLAFLAGAALASTASAATTYTVSGSINSTNISTFDNGAPFTVSFDYDPTAAGPDDNPNAPNGRYYGGISNISITVGDSEYTAEFQSFLVSYGNTMCTFTLNMDHISPDIDDHTPVSAQLQFFQFGASIRTDAAPETLDIPWDFGSFNMNYMSTLDGSEGPRNAGGGLDMGSLNAVPEPSSALLIGLGGATALLRRRRTRCS